MNTPTPEQIKAWTRRTFNAASEHFDDPQLSFWNEVGSRTVELAGLAEGQRVLDVCCGTGASALPAARRVGAAGRVLGIDFAEKLLEMARAKAQGEGLGNLRFEQGDLTDLRLPSRTFDAVLCVFGLFFAPDQVAALRGLWAKLNRGGSIAITAWGKRVLEPGNSVFWETIDQVRPDLTQKTPAWLRMSTVEGFTELFVEAGLPEPAIVSETLTTHLSAEDYWTVVTGSGYRGIIDRMAPEEAEEVRTTIILRLREESDGEMISDVLYGRAVRTD